MLIKNLSYDCNKVGSFLNVFRVFRYLNIYVPKGVRSNPLNPPPPHPHLSYASESIYSINAHVTRDREFMVAHNSSRQKQKPHGNNKIPHDKIKYFTAKSKIALVLQWVFAFAVRYLVFAVKYLVLP